LYKFSGFGDFDIAQLEEILKNFIFYIKSSKDNEERFRRSLYRSLILKAKIAKLYDQSVHDFLNGIGMERWRLGAIKEDTLKSVPISDSGTGFEDTDSIVDEALKAGYLEINKASDWNLKNAPANLNISVFTDSSIDDNDEEALKHIFSNVIFYKLRRQKTEEQYRSIYRQLVLSLQSSDKIYFTVSTQDDANIIKSAYEQHRDLVRQKLVILIHNTPTLIESNILQSVTVIGCFSSLYVSYVIDFYAILGRIEISQVHNLTISLGSNGSVYDHKKNNFVFSLNIAAYKLLPYFTTAKERRLVEENEGLVEENKRLSLNIEFILDNFSRKEIGYIIVIIILICLIILILIFPHIKEKIGIKPFFQKVFRNIDKLQSNNMRMHTSIILVIALVIIMMIWYLVGEKFMPIGDDIIFIVFLVMGMTLWYSLGKNLVLNNKESTIFQIIICAGYRFPKRIFLTIGSLIIISKKSPNFFQGIINVFKQWG
jgi:hypothetical protein